MVIESYVIAIILSLIGALLAKKIKYFEYIVLVVIIFLVGRGANTLDTNNYLISYREAPTSSYNDTYEKGYLFLEKLGNLLNFDYIEFRFFVVCICFCLVNLAIKKITKNIHFIYLFYLLFLVIIDTVQVRNFFAFSIVFFGLHYLLLNKKRAEIYFLFFILLASTIHISAILYTLLLLINFKNKKKLIYIITAITIVLCVFIFLGGNKLFIVKEIFSLIDSESGRLQAYTKGQTKLGFLYAFVLHFIGILVVYLTKDIINIRNRLAIKYSQNENLKLKLKYHQNIIEAIFWINIITIAFFPLYMTNLQFIRLSRNLIIINLIAASLVQVKFDKIKSKGILLNITILIMIFCWWYFTFIFQDHLDDIVVPFFDNSNILRS